MKKLIYIIFPIILIITGNTHGQTIPQQTKKLELVCKIWGAIKYYEPVINKSKPNWDLALIDLLVLSENVNTDIDLDTLLFSWFRNNNIIIDKFNIHVKDTSTLFINNINFDWIEVSNMNLSIKQYLYSLVNSKIYFKPKHVNYYSESGNSKFTNELAYIDSSYPTKYGRLLMLFRYWNIINYFFPHKYLMDQNWDDALCELIPEFINSNDTLHFHMLLAKMIAKTNDSHAFLNDNFLINHFLYKNVPFSYTIIDYKIVVTELFNDSLAALDQIQIGDEILEINGKTIHELIDSLKIYISGGNDGVIFRNASFYLLHEDSCHVKINSNNNVYYKYIHAYLHQYYQNNNANKFPTKLLNNDIGYINLSIANTKEVKKSIKSFYKTKGIILDLRNGSRGTLFELCNLLSPHQAPFSLFLLPVKNRPGLYSFSTSNKCGKYNPDYYPGKIVVLINENTQSHAEYTAMALKTIPNSIFIGTNTAGADGGVTTIPIGGSAATWMTGLGVFYPDTSETQRKGIIPDIIINPTTNDIKRNVDVVLNKAISVITNLNSSNSKF